MIQQKGHAKDVDAYL
jgi:hypothetical protein